ncbi:MAG: hypothetical protein ACKO6N_19360 [Myxococcota bacterium]
MEHGEKGQSRRELLRLLRWAPILALADVVEMASASRESDASAANVSLGTPSVPKASAIPIPLVLSFSAALDGELEPCGCPGGALGGLSRRLTLLKRWKAEQPNLVVLDAGNALLKTDLERRSFDKMQQAHALRMGRLLIKLGIQGMAVGERDLAGAGLQGLQQLAREGLPLLSANLVDAQGKRYFPASRVVEVGGLRVAVVGVTAASQGVLKEGSQLLPPIPAVLETLKPLRGKVDLTVLLSTLLPEDHEPFQSLEPELDLILTGIGVEGRAQLKGAQVPYVVSCPAEGRYLTRLDFLITPGAARPLKTSAEMERRIRSIQASQRALEDFAQQIIEEEGRLNPVRLEKDSQFLKERLATLKTLSPLPSGTRLMAFSSVPLEERIPEDPAMRASIQAGAASGVSQRP